MKMPVTRRALLVTTLVLMSLFVLVFISGCTASSSAVPVRTVVATVAATPSKPGTPVPTAAPTSPAATATSVAEKALAGPTFVLLRAKDVTAAARLNFMGQGFLPGEATVVTVESSDGRVEATLDPVIIVEDGRFDEVSDAVPGGLTPGTHVLHVVGTQSGHSGRASFHLRWLPPTIHMEEYSGKAKHGFSFTGSGFAPGEQVEVRLGGLGGSPLGSYPADDQGNVVGQDVPIPLVEAGDYALYFVGQDSGSPVSVGFNVQGFRPWAVLDNYAPPPYYLMGFSGEDFVPDEVVLVYLNNRTSQPVTQVQADANGKFAVKNAFELPLLKGENRVIFVGQQSNSEIAASFQAQGFGPGLELTAYAGRPGSRVAFVGTGWARNDTLHVSIGEKPGGPDLATFSADQTGAFRDAGDLRIPVRSEAGGLPLTVSGDVSQSSVTLWFQVLDLKPTAELTAYEGPPGTVVSFTGRSFAPGEAVHVHLHDQQGPELAVGVADDQGTIADLSSYPVDGNWGDVVPFVLVGEDSGQTATTHFKFANP
jgi:hypothetical protein